MAGPGDSEAQRVEVRKLNGDLLCHIEAALPLPDAELKARVGECTHIPAEFFDLVVCSFGVTITFNAEYPWLERFMEACKFGDELFVRCLARAFVSEQCILSWCPLHVAAHHRHDSIVGVLLEEGCSVNARTRDGVQAAALHIAARSGTLATMRALLQAKADVHAETTDGDRPLHFAACRADPEYAQLLLCARADVGALNSFGEYALDNAQTDEIRRVLESAEWAH